MIIKAILSLLLLTAQSQEQSSERNLEIGNWHLPNVCEKFQAFQKKKRKNGETRLVWRHKRIRESWTKKDQKRAREVAKLIAGDMGANHKYVRIRSLVGSSYNPTAVHILNEDLEANKSSWVKHRWTRQREEWARSILDTGDARSDGYWDAKKLLSRILIYKGNPYYNELVSYRATYIDGTVITHERPYFTLGYGPFDMNPVYYTKYWDASSPPWIMCNYDGIIGYVTAIWAFREHQKECEALGFEDSYAVIDRRYATGKCTSKVSSKFINRAREFGLDPYARAQLGTKWAMEETDRGEILEYFRREISERIDN